LVDSTHLYTTGTNHLAEAGNRPGAETGIGGFALPGGPRKRIGQINYSPSYRVVLADGVAHVEDNDQLRLVILSDRPGRIKGSSAESQCYAEVELLIPKRMCPTLCKILSKYDRKKVPK
jgi:hypothetical protein